MKSMDLIEMYSSNTNPRANPAKDDATLRVYNL